MTGDLRVRLTDVVEGRQSELRTAIWDGAISIKLELELDIHLRLVLI